MQIIPSNHVHSHLISTPQAVKFCKANSKNGIYKHTYAEVAWYEESTSVIFRKKVFSVKKYGVMQAYKLACDFRNKLIAIKAERMQKFITKVQKEIKEQKETSRNLSIFK